MLAHDYGLITSLFSVKERLVTWMLTGQPATGVSPRLAKSRLTIKTSYPKNYQ